MFVSQVRPCSGCDCSPTPQCSCIPDWCCSAAVLQAPQLSLTGPVQCCRTGCVQQITDISGAAAGCRYAAAGSTITCVLSRNTAALQHCSTRCSARGKCSCNGELKACLHRITTEARSFYSQPLIRQQLLARADFSKQFEFFFWKNLNKQ